MREALLPEAGRMFSPKDAFSHYLQPPFSASPQQADI